MNLIPPSVPHISTITPSQLEILALLEHGLLQREVAEKLSKSTKTVETQIYRLKKKFHCNSICQLGYLVKRMMQQSA